MTTFLRLLIDEDKEAALLSAVQHGGDQRLFVVAPDSFRQIPGAPFAYWISDAVRQMFKHLQPFENADRAVRVGLQTGDDFRFVRIWWEVDADPSCWPAFAKGGAYSPFYSDIHLQVNWANRRGCTTSRI